MERALHGLLEDLKELFAIWHWLSNLIAFLTVISEHGLTEGAIIWLLSGFFTAIISEIIMTRVPSYLRPFVKYFLE